MTIRVVNISKGRSFLCDALVQHPQYGEGVVKQILSDDNRSVEFTSYDDNGRMSLVEYELSVSELSAIDVPKATNALLKFPHN